MRELSATIQRRPAPLPVAFRPMADSITGGKGASVMLSTDTASRRALRKVGKVAATTDNVIHLADAPEPTRRVNEVIAHELTHIAHRSPIARFFDDVDDSPEERQAERVARVMATSPVAPTASTLAPARPGANRPADIVRRSPTVTRPAPTEPPRPSTPGALSASALAASITGTSAQTVQRLASSSGSAAPARSAAPVSDSDSGQLVDANSGGRGEATLPETGRETDAWLLEQLERNIDRIVELLEDRIVTELERRGGRLWKGL